MSVELSDDEGRIAWYAAAALIHERRLAGRGVPVGVAALHRRLTSQLGHVVDESDSGRGQLKVSDNLVGASEAAVILGCTERHVNRLAAELYGTRVPGRRAWLFPRDRVVAYARQRKDRTA